MTLTTVPFSELHPRSDNLRAQLTDIDGLAQSIRSLGILQPLVIQPNGDGYLIDAGHRRHAAISKIIESGDLGQVNPDEIPVSLNEADDDGTYTLRMLVENLQRVDIDPIEEAKGYARLVSGFDFKQKAIAAEVGRNQAHVSRRLGLLLFGPATQDAIRAGDISVQDAVDWIPEVKKHPELVELIDADIVEHGAEQFSHYRYGQLVRGREVAALISEATEKLTEVGFEVIDGDEIPEGYSVDEEFFYQELEGWLDEFTIDPGDKAFTTNSYRGLLVSVASVPKEAVSETGDVDVDAAVKAQKEERKRQAAERKAERDAAAEREAFIVEGILDWVEGNTLTQAKAFPQLVKLASRHYDSLICSYLGLDTKEDPAYRVLPAYIDESKRNALRVATLLDLQIVGSESEEDIGSLRRRFNEEYDKEVS